MRLRHIAKAMPIIEQSEFVEHDPAAWKGKWKERFGNDRPLHIDLIVVKSVFAFDQLHLEAVLANLLEADVKCALFLFAVAGFGREIALVGLADHGL